jgi:hypothetical protein
VADYPPHLGTVKPHLGTRPAGMQPTPRTQARKVKRGRHPSPPVRGLPYILQRTYAVLALLHAAMVDRDSNNPLALDESGGGDKVKRCENSVLCSRGFRHGGLGGRCNRRLVPIFSEMDRSKVEEDEACVECAGKSSLVGNKMLLCDGCDKGVHQQCLVPPLAVVPAGEWLCAWCVCSCAPAATPAAATTSNALVTTFNRPSKLAKYVEQCGGQRSMVDRYSSTTTLRNDCSSSDTIYESPQGKRFRSLVEVARFLGLKGAPPVRKAAPTRTAPPAPPPRKPALSLAPSLPPSASQRKRPVRLPEPEDPHVGKRLRVSMDGEWWTAKIVEAVQCIAFSGKSNTEYRILHDKDGIILRCDLQDPAYVWEFISDNEPSDEFEGLNFRVPKQAQAPAASSPEALNGGLTEDAALQRALMLSRAPAPQPPTPQPTAPPLPAHLTPPAKRQRQSTNGDGATQRVIVARTDPLDWRPDNAVSQAVTEAISAVLARARDESAASSDDLPILRKLRAIEWFAGSGRLSFALAQQHGWQVVIHDRDQNVVEWVQHGLEEDGRQLIYNSKEFITEVKIGDFWQQSPYDFFHFSIDCSSFSVLGHPGQFRNAQNDFLGEHASCKVGNQMVHKMLELIGMQLERNEKFLFTVENPQTGKLKDHPMVQAKLTAPRDQGGLGATPLALDFCWFKAANESTPFKKRTIIWTNSPSLIRELGEHCPPSKRSRFLCERTSPCNFFQRGHRPVARNCAAATPFPRLLTELIARCITFDASAQRWRRL